MIRDSPATVRTAIRVKVERGSESSQNPAISSAGGSANEPKRRRRDSGESPSKKARTWGRLFDWAMRTCAVLPSRKISRPDSGAS